MNYAEAMTAIKKNDLKSVYLISGEETYLTDKIEQALLKKLLPDGNRDGLQRFNGDIDLHELMNLIESAPFFTDKNVILLRGTTLFKEKKKAAKTKETANPVEEQFMHLLENMPTYSVLILETPDKADKRRKIYKTIAKFGMAAEVEAVRAWNIKDWLQEKLIEINKQFDREAYTYFFEITGVMNQISLGFLDQELDKLVLYTDRQLITKQDLLQVLSSIPEVSIFSMLDAISDKNINKAIMLLSEQLAGGIHPLAILTLLTRHTRQLWQAKTLQAKGYKGKQLAASLGLVPFVAEKVGLKSLKFTEPVLKKALLNLAEADYKLKSGQANVALLDQIVIELCM